MAAESDSFVALVRMGLDMPVIGRLLPNSIVLDLVKMPISLSLGESEPSGPDFDGLRSGRLGRLGLRAK